MKTVEFKTWLSNSYRTANNGKLSERPQSDAISRCRRVENAEGDLDVSFEQNRLDELLNRLQYTRKDEELGADPRHNIIIDGNVYNGTASLRNAIKLYQKFCIATHKRVEYVK